MSKLNKLLDPKAIEKRNKAFHKLSNRKQRVAIAEDVLQQLKLKKYKAETGIYVYSRELHNLRYDDEATQPGTFDLQKTLLGDTPQCDVCGLGAAFCSLARLGNNVTLDDADSDSIHRTLTPIFGKKQVAMIENAFEGKTINEHAGYELSDRKTRATEAFYNKYDNDKDRLKAIFKNVIKNDGTFKP
jgi:hypothetical protein